MIRVAINRDGYRFPISLRFSALAVEDEANSEISLSMSIADARALADRIVEAARVWFEGAAAYPSGDDPRGDRSHGGGPVTRHRLTASRIKLGRLCLWWARPDVELPASEASRCAEVGTAVHAGVEKATIEDETIREDVVDEAVRRVWREDLSLAELTPAELEVALATVESWRTWWKEGGHIADAEPELMLALDPLTERARRRARDESANQTARDYSWCLDSEIPGTADVVGIWAKNDGSEASLVVGDYKTGRGPHRLDDHVDQLTHLATAAALEGWHDTARIAVIHLTPHDVVMDSRVIDRFDMLMHLRLVRGMLEAIPTAEPRPGLHCDDMWCPARAVCPATRALLADAKLELEPRRRLPVVGPVESNDQALAVVVAVGLLEQWIEERTRAVKAYADEHGGVRGPDGRVYSGREVVRETPRLDVSKALETLREHLGTDIADRAVKTKVTTSWTAIEDAIRYREQQAGTKRPPIKDLMEHTREVLRSVGAVKASKFTQYEWRKS